MSKNTKKSSSGKNIAKRNSTHALFELSTVHSKPFTTKFSTEKISCVSGLLLLRKEENEIGIINRLTSCNEDMRHQGYL
jgi:hypothetical protein